LAVVFMSLVRFPPSIPAILVTGLVAALVVPRADAGSATPGAAERAAIMAPAARQIAPGLTYREFARRGPVVGQILQADLTEPTLHPTYLHAGAVTAKATLTHHATRAGAVAAVNGDFFDIGATDAPLGVGLDDGRLINGPAIGWNRAAAFYHAGGGTHAGLDRIRLAGTIRLAGGKTLTATNLNSPRLAKGGIGIYTPQWGMESRSQVVRGPRLRQVWTRTMRTDESVRLPRAGGRINARAMTTEVEVANGVVTDRSGAPGAAVAPGTRVLLGVGAGARALAGLRVGDEVSVSYRPTGTVQPSVGITGNVILLDDGAVVAPRSERQPRTAIGFSASGSRVWLVTVDGRSRASVGMTYVRLAKLLKSLGADEALNLDGGGSTTMVARMPGDNAVSVRNTPSDGAQRPVPNGIGFTTTARR
jgi:phosphodiester glycosidase